MRSFLHIALATMTAVTASPAAADKAQQVALSCLAAESDTLTVIPSSELSQEAAAHLIHSLDAVTQMGRQAAENGTAADWSMQETIIVAFGQQTDQLRTGALSGEVLGSDMGLLLRWKDPFLGSVCLLAIPKQNSPQGAAAPPKIGEESIIWRAAPTGEAVELISQIIVVSERPR